MTRIAARFAACIAAAASAVACTATPPPSPELMARCSQLYALWVHYQQDPVFLHTGERARAELALDGCRHGQYEANIRELEAMARRGGLRVDSPAK